jgi:hypothetical protein
MEGGTTQKIPHWTKQSDLIAEQILQLAEDDAVWKVGGGLLSDQYPKLLAQLLVADAIGVGRVSWGCHRSKAGNMERISYRIDQIRSKAPLHIIKNNLVQRLQCSRGADNRRTAYR